MLIYCYGSLTHALYHTPSFKVLKSPIPNKNFFLPIVNLIHSFAHQTFEFPIFFLPIIMIIHTTFDFREHHLYFFILFLETLKLYWVYGQIFISL
jgi:hypothetical protein